MKNNTSFDKKQHVVWQKTTRHLKRSKYSPTQYDQQGYELQVHSLSYNKCEIAVESPSLRARVNRSFIIFAVTSVTGYFLFSYLPIYYGRISNIF